MRMPDLSRLSFETNSGMSLPNAMKGSRMSQPTSREEQRDHLLEAALVHVPFDGWSRRALFAGAADLGLEPGAAAVCSRARATTCWRTWSAGPTGRCWRASVPSRACACAIGSPSWCAPVRGPRQPSRGDAPRDGGALLPSNAPTACASLWRTVDLMWVAAGDDARDASYYSKRSLLAGLDQHLPVLARRSSSRAGTWAFLERRIDNVMQIGRLRGRFDDVLHGLARRNPLAARR